MQLIELPLRIRLFQIAQVRTPGRCEIVAVGLSPGEALHARHICRSSLIKVFLLIAGREWP
jgi:hypothetical protein